MNGLYFYKLVSSFPEDVTKDCKLTVNEIDHNFMTLKKSDISNFYLDNDKGFLVLETKGGETYKADISHFTTDVSVKYDKASGRIEIAHDGVVDVIDDIVTKGNLSSEIFANIITDDTLVGNGTGSNPIGLSNIEKTGMYKSVIKVIDKTKGYNLPYFEKNALGDRYLTYEAYNEYGYLYNYPSALRFVKDLNSDWRIPTKADWDNTLNAIEICDEDRNHDSINCNNTLGKLAGKFLKSKDKWVNSDCSSEACHHHDCCCHDDNCDCDYVDDDIVDGCVCYNDCNHSHCTIKPNGVDSYGMRILPSGYGDGGMMMDYFGRRAKFWTSTEIQVTNMYVKRFDYDKSGVVQVADNPRALASVRLVKDYDGSNFRAVETIGGVSYKCVLLPAKNTTHGYLIWMASNLNASQKKYCPVLPNNGDIQTDKNVYYINEWNGFDWVKKELMEGDSLVIQFGPDNDRNAEYRLINSQLINVKKDILSSVINKYDNAIDEINGRLDVIEDEVGGIKDSIENINDRLNESDNAYQNLNEKIESEIKVREEVDTQMWEAINNEVSARTNVDTQMWEAINNEVSARTDVDNQIWEAVNNIISTSGDANQALWDTINEEIERSVEQDKRLLSKTGSTFSCADGILTLKADDSKNDITIEWDGNYGTF